MIEHNLSVIGGMKEGRPTKYKPRYAADLIAFFSADNSTINDDGKEIPGKFPTLARFACNVGVCSDTIRNWATQKDSNNVLVNPEFFSAYKMAKEYQEAYLYEYGLNGALHPAFAIWTTKTMLGHRETDAPHNEEAKPLKIEFSVSDARVRDAKP